MTHILTALALLCALAYPGMAARRHPTWVAVDVKWPAAGFVDTEIEYFM